MDITWKLEQRPLSSLKEYERNPRKITRKGLANLKESLSRFGIAEPLAIQPDGTIIGGHGRRKALASLKIKQVACYVPSRPLTLEEFKELNVRLNKNIAGEFDMAMLLEDFTPDNLLDIGFDSQELALPDIGGDNSEPDSEKDIDKEIILCPACGHQFYVG